VGAEWFHVDGRTDRQTDGRIYMTILQVAFRTFTKEHKKVFFLFFSARHSSVKGRGGTAPITRNPHIRCGQ
jgi:hypothetical protein